MASGGPQAKATGLGGRVGWGGEKASIHTGARAGSSRDSGLSTHFSVCVSSALVGKPLMGVLEEFSKVHRTSRGLRDGPFPHREVSVTCPDYT